ncbi:MAG TPA: ComEC/Rec2 family competence protein, partial [Flavobacterium sp.]
MNVLKFPLARVTLGFIIGIIIGSWAGDRFNDPRTLCFILALILLLCIVGHINLWNKGYFGFLVYSMSIIAGMMTYKLSIERNNAANYSRYIAAAAPHSVEVVLREKLKPSVSGKRFIAKVRSIDGRVRTGKILLIFPQLKSDYTIGTVLYFTGEVIRLREPLNPNQFDYRKYLENKSVYAQAKVKNAIHFGYVKDIWYYSDVVRSRMIENLRKSGFSKNELAVITALILGQQQEISAEILQSYQYAGAIHILSVSGLHVGFILVFLNFILKGVPNNRSGASIKFVVILLSLWSFAIIAGLAPSIVRSATMFSFVAWGLYLRRSTNIFHTLLVSLLLILLWSPSFLFDVGF